MKDRQRRERAEVTEVSTCVVEWIERASLLPSSANRLVSTCVVEWIERIFVDGNKQNVVSPPVWWSGLKGHRSYPPLQIDWSPPVWWSGLKDLS